MTLNEGAPVDRPTYRFGFVIEYAIGHVTFANMLQAAVESDPSVAAEWFFLPPVYDGSPGLRLANLEGLVEHLPPFNRNPTMLHSLRTRRQLRPRAGHLDAILIHTQTAALLAGPIMREVPTVVSLDATPVNFDEVGAAYGHEVGSPAREALKRRLMSAALRRTAAVMPWSHWVERSLRDDYGIPESLIRLIRPGIYPEDWTPKSDYGHDESARFLFVGGHFHRKGGDTLLSALQELDCDWQLDVVTKSSLPASPRIRVFNDIDPGDKRFAQLYRQADAFVLPTGGDAYGWAILEAMAAGLPVVSTSVGAIPELVLDGETGYLVRPHDPIDLRLALERIVKSADLRRRLGEKARSVFMAEHNAHDNMQSILEMLKDVSRARGAGVGP